VRPVAQPHHSGLGPVLSRGKFKPTIPHRRPLHHLPLSALRPRQAPSEIFSGGRARTCSCGWRRLESIGSLEPFAMRRLRMRPREAHRRAVCWRTARTARWGWLETGPSGYCDLRADGQPAGKLAGLPLAPRQQPTLTANSCGIPRKLVALINHWGRQALEPQTPRLPSSCRRGHPSCREPPNTMNWPAPLRLNQGRAARGARRYYTRVDSAHSAGRDPARAGPAVGPVTEIGRPTERKVSQDLARDNSRLPVALFIHSASRSALSWADDLTVGSNGASV
jgi:hypothetical protein